MYDLNGAWCLKFLRSPKFRGVVVNNGGGKIFSRLYGENCFENHHKIEFSGWSKMFGMDYMIVESAAQLDSAEFSDKIIIELRPNSVQSQKFWAQYDQIWKRP